MLAKFKKINGGSLTINGKSYKKGDVFSIDPQLIPPAFRDCVEQITPNAFEEKVVQSVDGFEIRNVSVGKYNVVNIATGKILNTVMLTKTAAEALLADVLCKEEPTPQEPVTPFNEPVITPEPVDSVAEKEPRRTSIRSPRTRG